MTATTYFSVDVETTGPTPGTSALLSIGAEAFTREPDGWQHKGDFYVRIRHAQLRWNQLTLEWWEQQNTIARDEAYADETLDRVSPFNAADALNEWVGDVGSDENVFIANPTGFDWQFVNDIMWDYVGANPFGYAPLCIRSMVYGLGDRPWGEDRSDWGQFHVPAEIPHHALYDARAQAESFRRVHDARRPFMP